MTVFVDTSAFYALLIADDGDHPAAASRWKELLTNHENRLFTSNYVVVETVSLLRSRVGVSAVRRFVDDILPAVNMIWVSEEMHLAAVGLMLAHGRRGPSLVDCSSFILMQEFHIPHAFAFDAHFTRQGS
ncbi:MAG TPA: PIN domain-containing protein [Armatimonadota bacterium]|nr:PIN domain-containing protein [Armatimonadota bacterium]